MRHDLPPDVVDQLERQHAQDVANINKLYGGGRLPPPKPKDPEGPQNECERGELLVPLLISVVSIVGLLWYFFRDLVGVAPWGSMWSARALSILAITALQACGGGGGGGAMPMMGVAVAPVEVTPQAAVAPPSFKPDPVNPGCKVEPDGHVACPLIASSAPIGVGVKAGTYATFTNRTGAALTITQATAETRERIHWSEFCAYLGDLITGQPKPNHGEVGCATKSAGEDYTAIVFGPGLTVPAGGVVFLNSHTEPALINHTYALTVRASTQATQTWRQPQNDAVIACNGQQQSTAPTPWRNESGRALQLTGASIYAQSGTLATLTTLSGPACIYVMTADGSTKYRNCDNALRSRGEVSFPPVNVEAGEYVSAQGVNACTAAGVWDWAAFLHLTGGAA